MKHFGRLAVLLATLALALPIAAVGRPYLGDYSIKGDNDGISVTQNGATMFAQSYGPTSDAYGCITIKNYLNVYDNGDHAVVTVDWLAHPAANVDAHMYTTGGGQSTGSTCPPSSSTAGNGILVTQDGLSRFINSYTASSACGSITVWGGRAVTTYSSPRRVVVKANWPVFSTDHVDIEMFTSCEP
jgi:hypothetical protein